MKEESKQGRILTSGLPSEVIEVFNRFLTAEMTTLGRGGRPITWPIMPIFWEARGLFVVFTSIGLPQKAFNLRRNPDCSLLFSEPTGSGLADPAIVMVQGKAKVDDDIFVSRADADPELVEMILVQAREMIQRQPAMSIYMSNPLTRYLMDWYFMRLMITIEPSKIQWWQGGSYGQPACQMEAAHVV